MARLYTLPIFNRACDVWVFPHTPLADPPDIVDYHCQVYFASRQALDVEPSLPNLWVPPVFLRFTSAEGAVISPGDIVGVDPGKGDFYKARWVQITHSGFPNEYYSVLVEQCDAAGTTPRP